MSSHLEPDNENERRFVSDVLRFKRQVPYGVISFTLKTHNNGAASLGVTVGFKELFKDEQGNARAKAMDEAKFAYNEEHKVSDTETTTRVWKGGKVSEATATVYHQINYSEEPDGQVQGLRREGHKADKSRSGVHSEKGKEPTDVGGGTGDGVRRGAGDTA